MLKAAYTTPRLVLMPASPRFARQVSDYYLRNRAFLKPFEPLREDSFFSAEEQYSLLTEEAERASKDQGYRFYLSRMEQGDEIIGSVSLSSVVRGGFQSCFFGYKLDQRFVNRGLMSEAVAEATRIAFEDLGLHRVEANIMPRNGASLRVAEKAGYQNEGLAIRYLQINGVWEDHIHMVKRNE